jgi:hypothetical protein
MDHRHLYGFDGKRIFEGVQMIVDPDFVDHWKTRMLVAMLGDDEVAPIYVLRLWAHCQNRRVWIFELPTVALKAICRFAGDADAFENAMVESGFVSRNGKVLAVVGWEEYNASLIAAWENGGKGGRPKKVIEENPRDNPSPNPQDNQRDNPSETHGEPMGDPIRLDKIRVDKRGIEEPKATASPKKSKSPPKTPLPQDFCISDRVRKWSIEHGHEHLDRHFENFIGSCKARGYTYVDWDEAFMNAVRNDWAKLKSGQPGRVLSVAGQSKDLLDEVNRQAAALLNGSKNA